MIKEINEVFIVVISFFYSHFSSGEQMATWHRIDNEAFCDVGKSCQGDPSLLLRQLL